MKGSKGISPIIATILLLLIVIAIVGFTFGFFQNLFTTSATATTNQLNATNQLAKSVRVDNVQGGATNTVTVRNTGSSSIAATSDLTVYRGGVLVTCTSWSSGTISPGGTSTCSIAGACAAGITITVTSPANSDSGTC